MNLIKRGDASPQEIRGAFVLYHTSKGVPYRGLWTRRADEADMFFDGDYRIQEKRRQACAGRY